jgi:hypothetical protein
MKKAETIKKNAETVENFTGRGSSRGIKRGKLTKLFDTKKMTTGSNGTEIQLD